MTPGTTVALATLIGTISRFLFLTVDYRQYPSYPQGYLVHLSLGAIAAFLGAVAIPALASKDFAAATFLALAAQQFREIRNLERTGLENLEKVELVPRGPAYIEGIAKAFEARNYIAMFTALITSGVIYLVEANGFLEVSLAAFLSLLLVLYLRDSLRGARVGDYAEITPARLSFKGSILYVDEIMLMNVGSREARDLILEHGLGAVLTPRDINARVTLANLGQRQAILHDLATILGIRRDQDEPEFSPQARLDHESGKIGIFIVPVNKDAEAMRVAIAHVPLLESAKRRPSAAISGRLAARRSGR